jgi:mannitol/fructose-specific phosphotransferase system IIA component (Ntr-type)
MISIANTLHVSDIALSLTAKDLNAATVELANLLRHDRRILDWNRFLKVLETQEICVVGDQGARFGIPHARTDSVQEVVMAAGRSSAGLRAPNEPEPCHYAFVIGIPSALAADYLRMIGALARIFRDGATEKRLRDAAGAEEFHKILSAAEMRI